MGGFFSSWPAAVALALIISPLSCLTRTFIFSSPGSFPLTKPSDTAAVNSGQASPLQTPQQKPAGGISVTAAKKYVGRYQLESGIIPISTFDITFENDQLWAKPSGLKKRRLTHESASVFLDEISGTKYVFNKGDEGEFVSLTFPYEGAEYTALRVVLPPASLKGNTTFRLKGYESASIVVLSGSFNYWNESQLVFGREGEDWVCRIDLEPGKHAYKFIVDGNWILDPANPNTEPDDYGVKNSVIVVSSQ